MVAHGVYKSHDVGHKGDLMCYVDEGHGLFTTHPLTRPTSAAA